MVDDTYQFDEQARRALFFAKYEAHVSKSGLISLKHLVKGILHEAPELKTELLGNITH